jgi:hypothetical protein
MEIRFACVNGTESTTVADALAELFPGFGSGFEAVTKASAVSVDPIGEFTWALTTKLF